MLGKPVLIGVNSPSLKANMTPPQKEILKGHVTALCAKLDALSWEPIPLCSDIIKNANERLDGSGYPAGKMGAQLSDLVRLVSVIKAVNKAIHRRNGIPARNPLVVYRHINECGDAYDKGILVEYIRVYGPNPIGTQAKFNGGFLAWIMDVNGRGEPVKVNIVKISVFWQATSIALSPGVIWRRWASSRHRGSRRLWYGSVKNLMSESQ
ncbi:hypothetical protein [Lonsdalea quercina]|uniref:hypothetical protein n=1 Tax=Lonsdalea quercina TaxID=71657 RepID=UPI003976E6CA